MSLKNALKSVTRLWCCGVIGLMLVSIGWANNQKMMLSFSADPATHVRLEVNQQPLSVVLNQISQRTGIKIHFSVLPEGLVTATCVGASMKQVLNCLLQQQADVVFKNAAKQTGQDVQEAWVLGASLQTTNSVHVVCQANTLQTMTPNPPPQENNALQTQVSTLLKLAQSHHIDERLQGISGLMTIGQPGNPEIRDVLEAALTDKEPQVRAQAVSSFTHRNEPGATEVIQTALQDHSVDVRLMAVEGIKDDPALLKQALHDQDETVRSLAALKLETLLSEDKP